MKRVCNPLSAFSAASVVLVGVCGAVAVPPPSSSQQSAVASVESGAPAQRGSGEGSQAEPVSAGGNVLNVELLGQVDPQDFFTNQTCPFSITTVCANDIWGYVSPSGREYAIIGLYSGTGFVDITDPLNPVVVGSISDNNSIWSDIRTLDTYAYNVNESGGGIQIIDLSQIDPPTSSVSLVGSFTASGLSTSHNIVINPESRYAYLCGANLGGGRLVAVDLDDPVNPVIAGQSIDPAYVHDADVVTYTEGPYAGREIAFCFAGGSGMKIIDVTDKSNMFTISTFNYPDKRYCHQGRLSGDRNFVFFNDELDEVQDPDVTVTTTRVVDVSDLSDPQLVTTFTTGLSTIDHNLFLRGDLAFEANYTSGLRIFNVADVNDIFVAGYYDTYPYNNGQSFNGAWGTFVDLPSGLVIVSDMQAGLMIFDVSQAEALQCAPLSPPAAGTNPNPKPRYLSVTPSEPGRQSALRVTMTDLPPEYAAVEGSALWVDEPEAVPDQKSPGQTVWRSRLTCEPVYMDWGALGGIQISDEHIVPGATYDVQALSELCSAGSESNFSAPLPVDTAAVWGDVVGADGNGPPDGDVNILDVAAVVDVVKGLAASPDVSAADVFPGQPEFVVNVLDVGGVVDALKGLEYPFDGPTVCP